MSWWVLDYINEGQYVLLISWIFWVVLSITLHELAHGWAALWQGDDTPRRMGHMTANPMVHMGPMSLLMFVLVGFAWGLMPVDPSRFRWKRRGRIVVAGAGPAMNIALALVSLTGAALWHRFGPQREPLHENLWIFLHVGGILNVALAAFNLLPVPPLDGSSILSGMSFRLYRVFQNPQYQMYGMFVLMVIFLSGLSGLLFEAAAFAADRYLEGVQAILPG